MNSCLHKPLEWRSCQRSIHSNFNWAKGKFCRHEKMFVCAQISLLCAAS